MPPIHCMLSLFLFVSRCESANCPDLYSLASPCLGFPTLNFATPMAKFVYSGSCCTLHQQVPRTSLHSSVYLTALISLSAGEMSSDSTSNCTIRRHALLFIHLTSPLCLSPHVLQSCSLTPVAASHMLPTTTVGLTCITNPATYDVVKTHTLKVILRVISVSSILFPKAFWGLPVQFCIKLHPHDLTSLPPVWYFHMYILAELKAGRSLALHFQPIHVMLLDHQGKLMVMIFICLNCWQSCRCCLWCYAWILGWNALKEVSMAKNDGFSAGPGVGRSSEWCAPLSMLVLVDADAACRTSSVLSL